FGVALLVILIAIVNYINLSTVKSMDRAKEVGIRKVVGSSVAQLRMRFFLESIIINLIAGLASIMLILVVFDSFKTLANLPESTQIINDWSTWKLLGLLFILSTVLSGIFPSLILSSLSPTSVLKGKFSHSSSGIILRKGLVIVQFSIATFLLIQTFTASKQLSFMMNKDLGFDANQVVVMNGPSMEENRQDYISFKNSLLERSAFQKIGLSSTVPGMATGNMGSTTNLNLDEDERDLKNNFYIYHVDSSFFETMGMEIIEGENFSNSVNFQYPILINEEALREWGISDPKDVIHKKMTYWGRENTIIGVVRDFHQIDAKSGHLAMAFNYSLSSADYISVKLGPGNVFEQIEDLEEIYKSHFGHDPFDPFFLDQNFDAQYRADQQFQQVFGILSVFAILITCLGLFGLASFTVAKRAKEIGIRKVLGANVSQLITLLSKDFVALVLTSSIIALPITYFLVKNWLEQYTFRIDLSFWLFAGPTLFILVIAFFTVFSKTFHVSNANPVNSLKDE
ncbi:MAG: FtsX-like permease family protein, partial [Ekhidna sp.]